MRRDPLFVGHGNARIFSAVTSALMGTVGIMSKLFLRLGTRLEVMNAHNLEWIFHRRPDIPLLSYSNHNSTMDDPFLWGITPLKHMADNSHLRWSLAAHDMCFTNPVSAWLFSRAQNIPIIRGNGIWQPSMNHSLDILNNNGWLHVFPEGKVNPDPRTLVRFKWGIGRLVLESATTPHIIPIYHCGMEKVKGYDANLPRLFKHVTVNIGAPVDMRPVVRDLLQKFELKHGKADEKVLFNDELRIQVTSHLFDIMQKLKQETEARHKERTG